MRSGSRFETRSPTTSRSRTSTSTTRSSRSRSTARRRSAASARARSSSRSTGSRRSDHGRGDELDGDRDRRGDPGGDRDAAAVGRGLLRLRADRAPRRGAPVALGLLWLPALRQAGAVWLSAFMAFTAGLLSFLGVEALSEAFAAPGGASGVARRRRARAARRRAELPRDDGARRSSDAGHGRHRAHVRAPHRDRHRAAQPRRGTRDRSVVRDRRDPARSLPDRRLHDPQRHRGPRDRDADREDARHASRARRPRLDRRRRRRSSAPGSAATRRATC